MSLRSIANVASVAALSALLPLGLSTSRAVSSKTAPLASDTTVQSSQLQRVDWDDVKKEKVRNAYWLLETADHDYDGHRVAAMEHLKRAGDVIGVDVHKRERGWGSPPDSDARLRRARNLLQEVVEETHGKEFDHLRNAIHEIEKALKIH